MQVSVKLNDMFSYSVLPILIIIIVIITITGIIIILNKPKKANKLEIKPPSYKNLISIKNTYLNEITILLNNLNNNSITSRRAYQTLSLIIRGFVYEATNIQVMNCTLKDIASLNIPILYELVREYYEPEFSKNTKGNIVNSINKTKEVIEKWN